MPVPTRRAKQRRGGIGQALGLKNAKLGMRVQGAKEPAYEGPEPGTPAFGRRADKRRRKLKGWAPFRPERIDDWGMRDIQKGTRDT